MHRSALLDSAVRSAGTKEAVVYREQRWTYGEFADSARRAATVLREAGLRPGDRLAVMTYNTPAFLFAAFGAWYAGAVLVPVNHKRDLRVVRADGADAEAGQTGEIWLRSDTRMLGYLDDEAATAEVFAGEWYRSGDLGRVDEDGFVTIVDRMKDVIITGGENVASQEVEGALRGHPDVLDVAVVGRPHPQWGETVVAIVVLRKGAELGLAGMREWLGTRMARYKIPRELFLRPELPRTPSGKITKHVLRTELSGPDGVVAG
ncbi:class I adenylate-forming enzyme family protein [Streptomyces sp. NPDC048527]|uniref:class I adenylate-forming enzyme family protein n=1 Tax=Streptomyces sp. NPDC048527 TaxID=3365568 RepID=UPI00371A3AD5